MTIAYDPVRLLRILRRDAYRCQVRSPLGTLCGAPAHKVDEHYRYAACGACLAQQGK